MGAGSVLQLEDDTCPKCGAPLAATDVVCLKCGYDLRANTVRTVETGTSTEPGEEDPTTEEFVTPGGGSAQLWGIVGAFLAVAAMIVAGINVPPAGSGWLVVVGAVVLAVYNIAVHTGTGLAAVAITARIYEQKFGVLELAAARMFAAFSLFEAVRHLRLPLGSVGPSVAFALAAGMYFLAVWGLFRKDRTVTLLIVLSHVLLWIVFQLGMVLAEWVHSPHAAAAAGAAGS